MATQNQCFSNPKAANTKNPCTGRHTSNTARSLDGETVDVYLSALQCLVGLVSTDLTSRSCSKTIMSLVRVSFRGGGHSLPLENVLISNPDPALPRTIQSPPPPPQLSLCSVLPPPPPPPPQMIFEPWFSPA